MRRRLLVLCLLLAFFNVPAVAQTQIPVICQFPPTSNAATALDFAARHNGAVVDTIPETNQVLMSLSSVPKADNDVRWCEVNQAAKLPSAPHSLFLTVPPGTPTDWWTRQPSWRHMHVPEAHTFTTGRGVIVAVIDSFVDTSHPALAGAVTRVVDLVSGKDPRVVAADESSASYLDASSASYLDESSASYLDESSASYLDESSASYLDGQNLASLHGTSVAGAVHAVAPDATIWAFIAYDNKGSADCHTLAKAARQADRDGAQVINISGSTSVNCAVLRTAIEQLLAHGRTVIASAGNGHTDVAQYPAAWSVSVGATTLDDRITSYTNYGPTVDLFAPGTYILPSPGSMCNAAGCYRVASGTSFAAPSAAGVAALVRQLWQTEVESRMFAGCINIDTLNPGYQLGHGLLDALKTVIAVAP